MPARRTTIYLPDEINALLGAPDSLSGRISSIVIRYAEICQQHRPDLTHAEWCCLFGALNGTWLVAESGGSDPARYIWHEIADSPDECARWGIDRHAFVAKLQALDYAACVAIVENVTRFWQLSELPTDEALLRLGLPRE